MTYAGYVPYLARMSSANPIKPRDRLLAAAALWAEATGRTLGALSAVVANHGSALDRLRDPANAVTDATLEKFAQFLADPANWPKGEVPEEAKALAHVCGVTPADAAASAGKGDDSSPEVGRAA